MWYEVRADPATSMTSLITEAPAEVPASTPPPSHTSRMRSSSGVPPTWLLVRDDQFTVIGSGAVYVFDAEPATRSNVAEARPDELLSIHGVRLDVLVTGERFDLGARHPIPVE